MTKRQRMKVIKMSVAPTDSVARVPTGMRPCRKTFGRGSILYGGGKYETPSTSYSGVYGGIVTFDISPTCSPVLVCVVRLESLEVSVGSLCLETLCDARSSSVNSTWVKTDVYPV